MAEDQYTKAGLMRKNKDALLALASGIEFISDENTKSEIADAILIMQITVFEEDEGPTAPGQKQRSASDPMVPERVVPSGPGIDDPDPEMSVRIRRIREASSNAKGAASRDVGSAETELKRGL